MQYQWAYDLYHQAVRNTWFPHEIALKEDLDDWAKMTEDERHAVNSSMSFFNPGELIVNRSHRARRLPVSQISRNATSISQSRCGKKRTTASRSNTCWKHSRSIATNVFNLHLDTSVDESEGGYINKYMRRMTEEKLDIETPEGKKDFIRNLVATTS